MIGKNIFLYVLFATVCAMPVMAQPGGCIAVFEPWRVCQPEYRSQEFVFAAKVSATQDRTIIKGNQHLWAVQVVNIMPIKGTLSAGLRFYLDKTICRGVVEVGKSYIFTAYRSKSAGSSTIVSGRWSTALDSLPKDERATLIEQIRSVAAGEKQPSVTGKIVRYTADPFDIYEFQGRSLLTKAGYDPKYAAPIEGVRVIARNIKGETSETITDAVGQFHFEKLNTENYEIVPVLPGNVLISAFQYYGSAIETVYRPVSGSRLFFPVRNDVCSEDIRFNIK